MSGQQPEVLVIGAGVCGLTSAICLAEAGLEVTIRASRLPLRTTSVAAGAIWGPHLVEDSERVRRWGRVTLTTLDGLAGRPDTGVHTGRGIEAWPGAAEPPAWVRALPGFRRCGTGELPGGYSTGWEFRAPLAETPVYLGYLLDRFAQAGGDVQVAGVQSLAEVAAVAPVVVNCTGAWAHHLVPDPAVRPVRGQAAVVANPGLTGFFIGPALTGREFVYMFPHGDTVVLGGTEEHGDWNTEPDPEVTRRILSRCAAIEPRLAGAVVLAERVGLRPVRPTVRLEAEPSGPGGVILHNYGHGGAGITLSWGCAQDITEMALRHLHRGALAAPRPEAR